MYYEDLTPYDYGMTNYKNALNVGWLEKGHEFPVGDFPEKAQVLEKLKSKRKKNLYRGVHGCDFCNSEESRIDSVGNLGTHIIADRVGNGEYIVQFNGQAYSAPSLIIHYIESHNYIPPYDFIDAVINDETNF